MSKCQFHHVPALLITQCRFGSFDASIDIQSHTSRPLNASVNSVVKVSELDSASIALLLSSHVVPSCATLHHYFSEVMADTPESGASTPNNSRFTSQAATVEDRIKADTIGLVTLDDFRKRRAEALEAGSATASGATTPDGR